MTAGVAGPARHDGSRARDGGGRRAAGEGDTSSSSGASGARAVRVQVTRTKTRGFAYPGDGAACSPVARTLALLRAACNTVGWVWSPLHGSSLRDRASATPKAISSEYLRPSPQTETAGSI